MSTIARLLPLWAAFVMVVGGGLPALHLASHRHAVCPEHGELVDVTDAHSVDHSEHISASHVDSETGGSAGHTHCGVLATLLQSAVAGSDAAPDANHGQPQASSLLHRMPAPPAAAALTRAPKTSPPV
jgi:hypothetical protein